MDASLTFDGLTPPDLTDALRSLPDALTDALTSAAQDIGARIQGAAQENAPVDRGRLRSSLEFSANVNGDTVRIEVGSNVDQAGPMEHGTDPGHFPPPSELRGWASRVLGDESAAYPIARSIAETGLEGREYLLDAKDEHIDWAIDRLNQAVESAFAEVGLA